MRSLYIKLTSWSHVIIPVDLLDIQIVWPLQLINYMMIYEMFLALKNLQMVFQRQI